MKHMNTPPTSFRLRLQLHAHVSNPYTFNLTKNTKVTASMKAAVPTGSVSITEFQGTPWYVPEGVTVVRVTFDPTWFIPNELYVGVTPGKGYLPVGSWSQFGQGEAEIYQCYNVLNQKTWSETGSYGDFETETMRFTVILNWSPVINAHAVNVTDY